MTRVRCDSCLQMVRIDDVHSCYDAMTVTARRDAEQDVLAAARVWWGMRGGPHDVLKARADRALTAAVERLVALEGASGR